MYVVCVVSAIQSGLNVFLQQNILQLLYQVSFSVGEIQENAVVVNTNPFFSRPPSIIYIYSIMLCVLCVCLKKNLNVVIPFIILDVKLVDATAGVTQEKDHTGFLHLPSAVLPYFFSREEFRRPFPSSTVKSILGTHEWIVIRFLLVGHVPSSCDCTEIRTHVPTSEGFEVTNWTTGETG